MAHKFYYIYGDDNNGANHLIYKFSVAISTVEEVWKAAQNLEEGDIYTNIEIKEVEE